eukprot:TRINITY_DN11822_c0_g1_i1.p1 TRINITY_DN11822_c0_g1~~TRINITY_DN11822_c0_g1_i1.p1  ORF type:complete len:304 (+),score=64.59 TRINITY_DN11822_c0_g1_i1:49-960(+)
MGILLPICWCWEVAAVALFAALLFVFRRRLTAPSLKAKFGGKVVVITGASAGMGRELALQLANVGAKLVLAARRKDRLDGLVTECTQAGAEEAVAVACDVTDPQQCKDMIAAADRLGGVHTLVANAGQGALMQVRDMKEEHIGTFQQIMAVNWLGCVYPVFYALESLRRNKGVIIVNSSLAGIGWSPGRSAYSASKHALRGFFNSLRCEEPDIQITTVYPGFVFSEIHDRAKTVGGKQLERNVEHFMSTAEASRLILEGARLGERDWPLTTQGTLAIYLSPILPELADRLAIKKAKAGLKNWD